ncbi:MAG TPA: amidase [Actinomycetota bacterium]|jgi:Asp-tRNA(Asn)/Glu-tRNA(Gln) amidotransferase A subunit family amidase|nr:amidase [Actinomycetota bacterium]
MVREGGTRPAAEEAGFFTASAMRAALRAGEVSSVELVERALARADRWQPAINAFSQLWPAAALEEAREWDTTPRDERPPLAGLPLAVKDVYDVAGHETSGCCAAYRGTVASEDASTIERVRRAGAVIIGKTNQHEISAGATNLVSACGRTGNPWDPARMTGGSSGGSGAAVAAGIVPFALGSDTGGSVRIPAAMCGVYGLKPTTGSIPIDGMLPHSPSLDCPGPMAWAAADLWTLYVALIDGEPSTIEPAPATSVTIGVPQGGYLREHVRDDVVAATESAASRLSAAGAAVRPVDGAGIEDGRRVWARVAYPELARAHAELLDRPEEVDPSVISLLEYGRSLDPMVAAAAAERRIEIGKWFRARLESFDALLVPTTVSPAVRHDEYVAHAPPGSSVPEEFVGPGWLPCVINVSGLPAVNLPAGRSAEGVPIGVSLVGHDGAEEALCGLAALWETLGDVPERPKLS